MVSKKRNDYTLGLDVTTLSSWAAKNMSNKVTTYQDSFTTFTFSHLQQYKESIKQ